MPDFCLRQGREKKQMKTLESVAGRRLSLIFTPLLWVLGVILLAGGIAGGISYLVDFPGQPLWCLIMDLVFFPLFGFYLLNLKIVWGGDQELYVRGFTKRITVPYSQIAEVRYEWWFMRAANPVIKVTFKEPTRFGRKVRFFPRHTFEGWFHWVHPDMLFLREKIRATAAIAGKEIR